MKNSKDFLLEKANGYLTDIKELGIWPNVVTLNECPTDREVLIGGKKYLFFSSNNYLGLANRKEIKDSLIKAVETYGFGAGASRIIGGTFDCHVKLEEKIAEFKKTEAAIIFSTGSITNDTVIAALANIPSFDIKKHVVNKIRKFFNKSETEIFSDELNHASIIDGIKKSGAIKSVFRHLDYSDLESKLKTSRAKIKIIISDSIFSMDGDCIDIKKLVELKNKYSAVLYIDEAHSAGVLGATGAGITEDLDKDAVDLKMGTFSKAFGGAGGYVAGKKILVDYLRFSCRKYIFSTAMPPSNASALITSIDLVKDGNNLRKHLAGLQSYFTEQLKKNKFDYLDSKSQIIPIIIGDEQLTMKYSSFLYEMGIYVPGVIWPATKRGSGRLRVSLIATHTYEDVDRLVNGLIATRLELTKNKDVVDSSTKRNT